MNATQDRLPLAIELVLTGRTVEQVAYLAGIPEPDLKNAVILYTAAQSYEDKLTRSNDNEQY